MTRIVKNALGIAFLVSIVFMGIVLYRNLNLNPGQMFFLYFIVSVSWIGYILLMDMGRLYKTILIVPVAVMGTVVFLFGIN